MDELMKRPTWDDDFVKRRTVEICMPRIRAWFGGERFDEREVADDLMKVLSPSKDGYEMASELERRMHWAVDSALVEVLDECTGDCDTALKELTSQWVRALRIVPQFAVGDTVSLKYARDGHKTGQVVKLIEDEARYGIRVEGQAETAYFLEKFEDVSLPVAVLAEAM